MSVTFLKSKEVKCKKPHRCFWCGEWINSGDKAQYIVQVFDWKLTTMYLHPECERASRGFDYYDDEGVDQYSMKRGSLEPKAGY